ncbi:hypothetical protein V565_354630, partial [Rhizoctonia solani 123E]
MKNEEIGMLRQAMDISTWLPELLDDAKKTFDMGPALAKIPSVGMGPDGKTPTIDYVIDPTAEIVFSQVQHDIAYIGNAVIRVSQTKATVSQDIKKKKQDLKQSADVEMADGDKAGPSGLTRKQIDEVVAKSVAKALKDEKARQGQKTSKHGPKAQKPPTNVGKGKAPAAGPSQKNSSPKKGGSGGGPKAGEKRNVSTTAEVPKGKKTKKN